MVYRTTSYMPQIAKAVSVSSLKQHQGDESLTKPYQKACSNRRCFNIFNILWNQRVTCKSAQPAVCHNSFRTCPTTSPSSSPKEARFASILATVLGPPQLTKEEVTGPLEASRLARTHHWNFRNQVVSYGFLLLLKNG